LLTAERKDSMPMREKISRESYLLAFLMIAWFFGAVVTGQAADKPLPTAQLPVVITTCGQSPGALLVKVLCDKNKIPAEQNELLKADVLAAKAKEGKPYKTLIITMGTSLKGMGAAGIDIDLEIKRINALIDEAKKQKLMIIGAHVEGKSRRADETDTASINAVAPHASVLIVRNDGNEDGLFTKIAEKQGIPLVGIKETLDLGDVLKKLFKM
jgi:hypothetical protein